MRTTGMVFLTGLLLLTDRALALENSTNPGAILPRQQALTSREVWRSTLDTNDLLKTPKPL